VYVAKSSKDFAFGGILCDNELGACVASMLRQAEELVVAIGTDCNSWFRDWRALMKAILSKSVIPAVLIIAGLAAGTGLLAGYIDGPTLAPQAAVDAQCDNCPHVGTDMCPMMTGASADPQTDAAPCTGTAADASPCTGMAAGTTPCTGTEGCPMPCCQKTAETLAAGCTMAKPQATGCPFLDSSTQAVTPCGAGGCAQEK